MEDNSPRTPRTAKLAASELRRINLNGTEVPYVLMRCRRKTIGMRINSSGLTVRIPLESLGLGRVGTSKKSRLDCQKAGGVEK